MEKLQLSLQKTTGQPIFFPADPFERSNLRSLSKIYSKMHKNIENLKI